MVQNVSEVNCFVLVWPIFPGYFLMMHVPMSYNMQPLHCTYLSKATPHLGFLLICRHMLLQLLIKEVLQTISTKPCINDLLFLSVMKTLQFRYSWILWSMLYVQTNTSCNVFKEITLMMSRFSFQVCHCVMEISTWSQCTETWKSMNKRVETKQLFTSRKAPMASFCLHIKPLKIILIHLHCMWHLYSEWRSQQQWTTWANASLQIKSTNR